MISLLTENPLLTLFAVVAIGYAIGSIRIGSFSLGVAAVLFTGLGVSAVWPELALPEIVYQLGLVLFVYTIGLASGPGFLASLRHDGVRLNALGAAAIVVAAVETLGLVTLLHLDKVTATGMFTGALTNTPALAGILSALPHMLHGDAATAAAAHPVVGYSLAYPIGVLGAIAAMSALQRLYRVDHRAEARAAGLVQVDIQNWTVRVTRRDRPTIQSIAARSGAEVAASRVLHHHDELHAPAGDEPLERGDLVAVVGAPAELRRATRWLGEHVERDLVEEDGMTYRRVFVSNPELVGRPLSELHLPERHGVTISRVRRGDLDVVATPDTVLELGDRARLVAPRDQIAKASRLVGDSYRKLSELDILTFSAGIVAGLLVGLVPIPLPGGSTVHLGVAGGPLVVALILGAVGRTGRIVWQIPYSANLTVRQIGVVLFLAGIGTRAGQAFGSALSDPSSLLVIAAGAILTFTVSVGALVIAHKLLRVPFGQAMGMLGGLQTQPALLAYANEQTGSELANRGYTTVYPMAMIAKIITAQVLLAALL